MNTERGVEFELKSRLDDARLTGFDRVAIEGEPITIDDVAIHREADLVDVDLADYTVAELREPMAVIADPTSLEQLRAREREGGHRAN